MPKISNTTTKSKQLTTSRKAARKGVRRTKAYTILNLLKRSKGASVADLRKATGWLEHSVRAALTGLRKKGHEVVRKKEDGGVTRYYVAGEQ